MPFTKEQIYNAYAQTRKEISELPAWEELNEQERAGYVKAAERFDLTRRPFAGNILTIFERYLSAGSAPQPTVKERNDTVPVIIPAGKTRGREKPSL